MNVPPHIQHLRCLVNYEALRFSSPISALAKKLVNRMIEKSSRTGGKYVSVHLRFEEVIRMLIFHFVRKYFVLMLKRSTKFKLIIILFLTIRTWWPSHAACMVVERLKRLKWIQLEKKGGG